MELTSQNTDGQNSALEPLTVSIAEARRLSGLGTTKLYELINAGTLKTTAVGRRTLIQYRTLKRLLIPEAIA